MRFPAALLLPVLLLLPGLLPALGGLPSLERQQRPVLVQAEKHAAAARLQPEKTGGEARPPASLFLRNTLILIAIAALGLLLFLLRSHLNWDSASPPQSGSSTRSGQLPSPPSPPSPTPPSPSRPSTPSSPTSPASLSAQRSPSIPPSLSHPPATSSPPSISKPSSPNSLHTPVSLSSPPATSSPPAASSPPDLSRPPSTPPPALSSLPATSSPPAASSSPDLSRQPDSPVFLYPPARPPSDHGEENDSEAAGRLDLARAYVETGDARQARPLLEELRTHPRLGPKAEELRRRLDDAR